MKRVLKVQVIITFIVFAVASTVLLLALNYLIDFIGWLCIRDKTKDKK